MSFFLFGYLKAVVQTVNRPLCYSNRWMNTILLICFHLILGGASLQAFQPPSPLVIPNADYYRSYEFLKDGRTDDADAGFRTALRPLNLPIEQRGFESIPSLVMLGETYYHQGHLSKGLEYYESALTLLARSSGWIRFAEPILPVVKNEGPNKGINWAASDRKTVPGSIATRWQYSVMPNGVPFHAPTGEVSAPGVRATIDAMEILRTSAIALRRRWQLLGPSASGSKLSRDVEQSLASHLGKFDPAIQAGHKLCQALASLSSQDDELVLQQLREATSIPGGFDSPLTPIGLMVQGELASRMKQWPLASRLFMEASLVAAHYEQNDLVAEAVQNWSMIEVSKNEQGAIPILQQITNWSRNRSRFVLAASTSGLASLHVAQGESNQVAISLRQLKSILAPRDVLLPRYEGLGHWTSSRAAFGLHNPKEGIESLDMALKYAKGEDDDPMVAKVLQFNQLQKEFQSGKANIQHLRQCLQQLLREPSESDWILNPLESLSWKVFDKSPAFELWIQSEILQGTPAEIATAVDAAKRFSFTKMDPLGGRLLAVRQLFTFESRSLDDELSNQALRWKKLCEPLTREIQKLDSLIGKVNASPIQLDTRSFDESHRNSWESIVLESNRLENSVSYASLANLPCTLAIPPILETEEWTTRVENDDLVIGYFESGGSLFGIAMSREKVETWKVGSVIEIQRVVGLFLELIGVQKELTKEVRREQISKLTLELRKSLLPKNFSKLLKPRAKITFVPYSFLWYFPFELLPAELEGGPALLANHPTNYAGTFGLALKSSTTSPVSRSIVLSAPKYLCDNDETQSRWVKGILVSAQGVEQPIEQAGLKLQSSRWAKVQADRVCVLGRIFNGPNEAMAPFGYDADQEDGALVGWAKMPMRAPKQLILPGLETGLVRGSLGNGRELFRLACILPATGNQSLLVSRWPMRGQSCISLLTTYVESLEQESSSSAWHRAVLSNWEERFEAKTEPNLIGSGSNSSPGTTPILWAGFMQIGETKPANKN